MKNSTNIGQQSDFPRNFWNTLAAATEDEISVENNLTEKLITAVQFNKTFYENKG